MHNNLNAAKQKQHKKTLHFQLHLTRFKPRSLLPHVVGIC